MLDDAAGSQSFELGHFNIRTGEQADEQASWDCDLGQLDRDGPPVTVIAELREQFEGL